MGVRVSLLTPEGFSTFPMPSYPSLRLAIPAPGAISRIISHRRPSVVHIATEGPLGFIARSYCIRAGLPFTTCYHTRFPEYLAARAPVPVSLSYAVLRRFHNAAAATMVSTGTLKRELGERGFRKLLHWRRGIPVQGFARATGTVYPFPGPIFLYVGRVAVEKNLEAFLQLDLPGTKVVVGDGPARGRLSEVYRNARFLGRLDGAELASAYAGADALVFPSLTDTFGLVVLEALATGLPVAAFPVSGPRDIIGESGCGVLDSDLRRAALAALHIPREKCRAFGALHGLRESARRFLDNIRTATGVELLADIRQAAG